MTTPCFQQCWNIVNIYEMLPFCTTVISVFPLLLIFSSPKPQIQDCTVFLKVLEGFFSLRLLLHALQ